MTRKSRWMVLSSLLLFAGTRAALAQGVPAAPPHFQTATNRVSRPSAAAADDIRDIRGPLHIPYSWMWAVYVLGGLTLGGLLAVGCLAWRRRPKVAPKLPHEIALERLQEALGLMTEEQAREFSIAVSNAVRFYIEDRFRVQAAHRTTEEFLHDLLSESSSALARRSGPLEDFLRHCDLAKFARWALSKPEMQSMHDSARKFVEETK